MAKFRFQRGSLVASKRTMIEVASIAQLMEALRLEFGWLEITERDVEVSLYHDEPDDRIGWERTFIVKVKGEPAGFADEELK